KYSIENTFLTRDVVIKTIASLAKLPRTSDFSDVDAWIDEFADKVEKLVIRDIYNDKNSCGVAILGENESAERFFVNKNSNVLC
ncbi:hypothetical protein, partial [Vibrio campbellii]|uniref:hypothetical protein n=1 Tax=Vibrio campbellii TaxID=680 RepID=UPI000AAD7107